MTLKTLFCVPLPMFIELMISTLEIHEHIRSKAVSVLLLIIVPLPLLIALFITWYGNNSRFCCKSI